jgi:MBG domain-containing protein
MCCAHVILSPIFARVRGSIFSGLPSLQIFAECNALLRQAAPHLRGRGRQHYGDARKQPFFRAQNPFNNFVPGFGLGQAENVVLMVRREDRVLFVSSETFGRTDKNMNTLKNSTTTTLLSTGGSKRPKSLTLFVTALLLAMLVGSMAAQAQTATLVVTAINAGRFYGDSNPEFTGTIKGLAPGDNITVTFTCVANPGSSVGDYVIVPTLVDPDNKLGNYNVVINNGTLTVTPAPLSIVADDVTRTAGQPNPAFTGTITGIKNGDDITATHDSPATVGSEAGTYPIIPTLKDASGRIGNYAVTISNGTLTVTP